jgi:DNA-binding response OmpR family regulator
MDSSRELVLVVAHNAAIIKTIATDTLNPLGYQVEIAHNASNGLEAIARFSPDLVIIDLNLQDLSGKDLLVAIKSKAIDLPVIVISRDTAEGDILRAFRLGAADFICWPATPAEIVATVDRALKYIRSVRERDTIAEKLKQANVELTRRNNELSAFLSISKAIVSTSDQPEFLSRIITAAIQITSADYGWLVSKQDDTSEFYLYPTTNLPRPLLGLKNKPWKDDLWSFAIQSGELLSIHGKSLEKYDLARLGKSVLLAPLKEKGNVKGILTVMRKSEKPFMEYDQILLHSMACLASISILNAHLLQQLEGREVTHKLPGSIKPVNRRLEPSEFRPELEQSLDNAINAILTLSNEDNNRLSENQTRMLQTAQKELQKVLSILEGSKF